MRRSLLLLISLLLTLSEMLPGGGLKLHAADQPASAAGSMVVPAARQAKNVAIITVKGLIDGDQELSIKRRMGEAIAAGANALVFEIDSPGGEVGAVLNICNEIKRCPIANTVAWVNPQAYSGGAIMALACREIVISDAATMGDAAPIAVSFGMFLNSLPEAERAKLLAPLLQEVVDSARLRGYDEKLVQGFVSLGVELWLVERIDSPGEMLFVDRNEFRILFDADPEVASPTLVGPSPKPEGMGKAPEPAPGTVEDVLRGVQKNLGKKRRGGSGAPVPRPDDSSAPPDDEATRFVPAAPNMSGALGADVSDGLETPSGRPILTAAKDRGKWRLKEYVSDGRSLYTLKQRELFAYGLAAHGSTSTGTINNDEELKAFFGASHLARLDRNALEATAAFLNHIVVKGLLIAIFLIGFFIELIHPGLIFPGSAAAIALVLLVAPAIIMGLGAWWQVGAILLGILLLAVEVFILPGFGIFGVLGLLSLFGGLVGTFTIGGALFPDSPGRGDAISVVLTLLVATATAAAVIYFVARNLGSIPMLNKLVLSTPGDAAGSASLLEAIGADEPPVPVGEIGVALSPLRPAGRARFADTIVDVVSESGYIATGQSVRVVEASPFRIVVEPATGVARSPASNGLGGGTT
ncbi:MAG: NfeD family protein [Phycisphaerales bacterium]